jgi:uncharacterized membrane protein
MNKSRLEAFSDGVFAIIITIMVLELKIPEGTSWDIIRPLVPTFIGYILSFAFVAIYWVNHHHLMHTARRVSAGIMWANMHLLFWLSVVPFVTGWMGRTNFEKTTVATYGVLLLLCGISYSILRKAIQATYKEETTLTMALAKSNHKEWASIIFYSSSIPIALFVDARISAFLFAVVSVMWIIPSKAIEHALEKDEH